MKSIRKGNDIHIRWRIMRGLDDENLSGRDISVSLKDSFGRESRIEWEIDGSLVMVHFPGRYQDRTGSYYLTLTENDGRDGMVTVDRTEVFRLVARQNSVMLDVGGHDCCCHGINVETVNLTTDLNIPSLGKGVIRVYNISQDVWGAGLETKGEGVGIKIAADSADVLTVDDEGIHINKDAVGGTGGEVSSPGDIDEIIDSTPAGQAETIH